MFFNNPDEAAEHNKREHSDEVEIFAGLVRSGILFGQTRNQSHHTTKFLHLKLYKNSSSIRNTSRWRVFFILSSSKLNALNLY